MAIDRRTVLVGIGALLAAQPSRAAAIDDVLYGAARRGADGRYSAAILDSVGRDLATVPLPGRGHDATFCPLTRRCVVFARRPGNFAVAFTTDRNAPPVAFTTPDDRHFYGHGIFSRDGRLLFATENDFEAGRGVIGVYDATDRFRRIGEMASHGVGPHDMALMQDGEVLVVANGGLKEHPDIGGGRRVLNADAVETSLVYIATRTGDVLERHDLPANAYLSLRHLDVSADGTVVLGAQAQGAAGGSAAMVFRHRRQGAVAAVHLPQSLGERLHGYVSSVAVARDGATAAVTSSKGGIAIVVEVASGHVLRIIEARDVSGIAPADTSSDADSFTLTTGDGGHLITSAGGVARRPTPWQWDNHLAAG